MKLNFGRRPWLFFALSFGTVCSAASAQSAVVGQWPRDLKLHTSFSAGFRSVDHASYDGQGAYGIGLDFYRPRDFLGYEIGFSFALDDVQVSAGERKSEFYEGYVGLRKTFGHPDEVFHTFVAVGGTYIQEEVNFNPADSMADPRATGAGGYARVGAYWCVANIDFEENTEVNFGVDLRGVIAEDIDFLEGSIFFSIGR
jgi:hypothetical protein